MLNSFSLLDGKHLTPKQISRSEEIAHKVENGEITEEMLIIHSLIDGIHEFHSLNVGILFLLLHQLKYNTSW